jgi:hypothetical protein
MDDLKKFDIKVFAKTWEGVKPEAFMGVFQRWIQQHTVPGILVDAADYVHIHQGHGTVLVAHEYNLSMDYAGGRPGLLYRAKQPAESTLGARIEAALRLTLGACRKLEEEPEFAGRLTFDMATFMVIANDRLVAPNDDGAYASMKAAVERAVAPVFGGGVIVERVPLDPRERLTLSVSPKGSVTLSSLVPA